MSLCTSLQEKVLDLETAKTAPAKKIASLKKREDASKQGRKIADLDDDDEVTLIDETQEINDEEMLFDVQDDLQGEEVVAEKEVAEKQVSAADLVTTAGEVVTTANVEVTSASAPTTTNNEFTLAQTLIEIKATKPKAVTTAATTTTTTRPKARGVVVQEPTFQRRKIKLHLDEDIGSELHAEEQAELERMQKEKVAQEEASRAAIIEELDSIQAMIEADEQLAARL
ncbi:hypothetical protein Tco_0656075 [Tanacetum coccineum]|uniref:Uncharacterized protein n=1 Tax=Tanacetum coccineum TaxID=301880 RepID=A0ABQ4X8Z5_9ASTR